MAERIIAREIPDGSHAAALDMLAREELGIDPQELGGSAWQASITSFLLFAAGAIVPVIPFAFGSGWMAVLVSLLVGLSRRTRCPGKLSSSFDLSTAKLPGNSDVPVIHYPENATVL